MEIAYPVKVGSWVRIPPAPPVLCPMLAPTTAEIALRDAVMAHVRSYLDASQRIMLPPTPPNADGAEIAMVRAGEEANPFGGRVGPYRYQFEGEDDLLHLMVVRNDYAPLTPEEAQQVLKFVWPDVTPGLVWLKPGTISQHFYLGEAP